MSACCWTSSSLSSSLSSFSVSGSVGSNTHYVPVLLALFLTRPPKENFSNPIKSNSSQIPPRWMGNQSPPLPLLSSFLCPPACLPSHHLLLLFLSAQFSLSLTDTPPLFLLHSSSTIFYDHRNYTLQSPLLLLSGWKKGQKGERNVKPWKGELSVEGHSALHEDIISV